MKERTEKEQEITEQELETIDAGARMQRASTTDVRQTRRVRASRFTEAELGGISAGRQTRQANQDPVNLDARTRRAGGRPDGKIRYAGDQEVTEL